VSGHVCKWPDCDEPATAGKFGRTYCEAHNAQAKAETQAAREQSQAARPKPSLSGLRGEIKDAVMMTAAVVAIRDPRIYIAVDATVDEFATSWANVAKSSPTAARYIRAMLSGGVWVAALGSTLVMVVTVAACTGNLPPSMGPLGQFCVGKSRVDWGQIVAITAEMHASQNGRATPAPEPVPDPDDIPFP
jgi:uncharacterized Zn finger protein (UPF0148 family)